MIRDLMILGACALLGGLLCYEFHDYLTMPAVFKSYSADKCVKIIYKDQVLPCSELKNFPRYDLIWVK